MARYIDADKVLDKMMFEMAGTGHQARAMAVIRYAETADVVPKSEAENYKKIAEHQQSVSMRRYFEIKQLKEELAKTKQEVAREIFEEIERTFKALLMGDITDIEKILAELKKKYTESEDKG